MPTLADVALINLSSALYLLLVWGPDDLVDGIVSLTSELLFGRKGCGFHTICHWLNMFFSQLP